MIETDQAFSFEKTPSTIYYEATLELNLFLARCDKNMTSPSAGGGCYSRPCLQAYSMLVSYKLPSWRGR